MGLVRHLASGAAALVYRPGDDAAVEYHKWYYGTMRQNQMTWMGIPCWKSTSDMWNYQEILWDLGPGLVVEFGTNAGGSAVFFAHLMRQTGRPFHVLSVDISHRALTDAARLDPDVTFVESSSTDPEIGKRIGQLKEAYPGPVFAILDSDHTCDHVLAEMKLLRPLLTTGDYLVVEDSNINGHPVMPGWGPGPFEAIEAYEAQYPADYSHDVKREAKFGWTFATNGYLIRN
ncbi:rhamnosyl O-methyltransferase [Mycobacteriaceae bacterium 1482268.1]|nr:rhamnosyl O-methyltransferase [Mycobacteriaceae bacterium 1482268.1]